MKNILKTQLTRVSRTNNSNIYTAELIGEGNINCEDIIRKLSIDGLIPDEKMALEIISLFNRKASELVASGYKVNTGLVSMKTEIKGLIYDRKWSSQLNKLDVAIKCGKDLLETINKSDVEIQHDQHDSDERIERDEEDSVSTLIYGASGSNRNDNPACGIAFRQWLSKV